MPDKFVELKDGVPLLDLLREQSGRVDVSKSILIKECIDDIINYITESWIAHLLPREGKLLHRYASGCKGIIVEIGTCNSGGTVILGLSDSNNSNRVHSIDIIKVQTDLLTQFGLQCNLIQSDSHEAGRAWDKGPIDLVFIDGCHVEEHAYKDMEIWGSHLRKGGYMLIHDCLRDRIKRRYKRRGRMDKDGLIKTHSGNVFVNVNNAVIRFKRDNPNFEEIEQVKKIKVLKKI